jgi:hypothetical protein
VSTTVCYRYLVACLLVVPGCFQPPPADTNNSTPGDPHAGQAAAGAHDQSTATVATADLSAHAILSRLLATYAKAESYADQGIVRLEFQQGGQTIRDQWPSSVQFARPNRLVLNAFQATVHCDGKQLVATIDDPPSKNLDGQALVRPAPEALGLTELASDPLLYDLISSQLGRQPIQLGDGVWTGRCRRATPR